MGFAKYVTLILSAEEHEVLSRMVDQYDQQIRKSIVQDFVSEVLGMTEGLATTEFSDMKDFTDLARNFEGIQNNWNNLYKIVMNPDTPKIDLDFEPISDNDLRKP